MASQDLRPGPPSSSHRLPTVSASQALQSLQARGSRAVSTGLTQLNRTLAPPGLPGRNVSGGYMRGKVTEVFGPPGIGKTAFGIQAAVNALREGQHVVWVDAACAPLVPRRFNNVLVALPSGSGTDVASPPEVPPDELQSHFHHVTAPTLAHLLALFGHPPSSFPPPNTGLIVIDSLSTLFDNAYPRNADDRAARNKSDQARWASGRKFAIMNELISTLTKTAALHDIALLLTCQTITRIRGSSRAVLVPAMSGAEWENGISTRLVLFRDWVPGQGKWSDQDAGRLRKARFVGVVKANGVTLADEGRVGNVVPFAVDGVSQFTTRRAYNIGDAELRPVRRSPVDMRQAGLCDMNIAAVDIAAAVHPPEGRPPKRRFTEISDEGEDPDSDELYGWVEDDEVAAEGLLIDKAAVGDNSNIAEFCAAPHAESRTDGVALRQSKKVARPNTC